MSEPGVRYDFPDLPGVIADPGAWPDFLFADTNPARLEALRDALAALDPAEYEAAPARLAHTLQVLGQTSEAIAAVEGRPERLSRAQHFLALAQRAVEECDPAIYARIIRDAPLSFGRCRTDLDWDAQCRLDYVLGIAHAEIGDPDEARRHLEHTTFAASRIGNAHLENASLSVFIRSGHGEPLEHGTARMMALLGRMERQDNAHLFDHLVAQTAQNLLLTGRVDEVGALVARAGAQGVECEWWEDAIRVVLATPDAPADLPPTLLAPRHPLMLLAHATRALHRAREALENVRADAAALQVARVALDAPEANAEWQLTAGIVRVLPVFAHLYAGDLTTASRLVRELRDLREYKSDKDPEKRGPALLRAWLCLAALAVVSRAGAVTVYDPREAHEDLVAALDDLDPLVRAAFAAQAVMLAPSTMTFVKRDPRVSASIVNVVWSRVAYLGEAGLRFGFAPVPKYPTSDQQIEAIIDELQGRESNYAMALTRHRQALASIGGPPLAVEWRVATLAKLVPLPAPVVSSPAPTIPPGGADTLGV